jgi:ubiquinone/menaquinone biosynthesis C-methylase UbiE
MGVFRVDAVTFEQIHEVLSRIFLQDTCKQSNTAFYGYCGSLLDRHSLRTYIRHKLDILRLGPYAIRDATILDAGCGFGTTCLLFAMLGAKEVHGIDVLESRLRTFQSYLGRLDRGLPVFPRLGDVSNLDYPEEYFDIVFSNEAISHYRDVPGFVRSVYRVLKKGGVLLVADGNNGANRWLVRKNRKIWQRFEQGPAGEFAGHKIEKPYLVMRREIIQQEAPRLGESELALLSEQTFGMGRGEIREAIRNYHTLGTLPKRRFTGKECPLNPQSGVVIERFFHPIRLAEEMSALGLKSKAYAYFGGAGGNPVVRSGNWVLSKFNRFSIYFASGFRIVAVKSS